MATRRISLLNAADLHCYATARENFLGPDQPLPAIWNALGQELVSVREGTEAHPLIESRTEPGFFLRLKDVTVLPRWGIVAPEPGVFLSESAKAAAWLRPNFKGLPGVLPSESGPRILRRSPKRMVEGPHLLLLHAGGYNYGHWLLDCVAGAMAFLPELRRGDLRLITPPLRDWQRRTLRLLDIDPSAVTEVTAPVVGCADLVFSSLHGMRDRVGHDAFIRLTTDLISEGRILYPSREPVASAQQNVSYAPATASSTLVGDLFRMLRDSSAGPGPGTALIYVSREGASSQRVMTNERELARALKRVGFTILQPETLTIDQQIRAFSSARVVAGAVGAGLTNMGFALPGCVIVEIVPSNCADVWNLNLAGILGHRYTYVLAPVPDDQITPVDVGGVVRDWMQFTFEAPIAQVIQTVGRIVEETKLASMSR